MKKLLLTLLLTLSLTALFANNPWRAKSEEEYLKIAETLSENAKKNVHQWLPVFNYQLNKDFSKVPYETFKTEIGKIISTSRKLTETSGINKAMFTSIRVFPNLREAYLEQAVKDPSLNSVGSFYDTLSHPMVYTAIKDKELLRVKLVEAMFYQIDRTDSTYSGKKALQLMNTYKRNLRNWEDKTILEDLKKIRKYSYSKIAANENWKQVLVEVELLIKAYSF